MMNAVSRIGAAAALALVAVAPSHAQELTPGSWTGSVTPPGGEPIPVMFEVSVAGGAVSVVMSAEMIDGSIPFNDVRMEGSALTFWWEPGARVECTLTRTTTGGFEGPCSDGTDSGAGSMMMQPPGGQE